MKKGQVYEGIVERVDFPNKGIVKVGEETCVVKNSLPGQKIQFCVNKVRKGKAEARLLEVLEKSPLEVGAPCSYFGLCGGCTYLSLPYEKQLEIKGEQVKKLLDNVLKKQDIPYQWEGIKGSPQIYGYRNKMEFSFGDEYKDGPLSLGMHKRGSFYDVVHVDDCQIVDEDYRRILSIVLTYFRQQGTSFYHRLRHVGFLRHLLVRKASKTGEILIALVTTSQEPQQSQDIVVKADAVTSEDVVRGHMQGSCEKSREAEHNAKEQAIEVLVEGFKEALLQAEAKGEFVGKIAGILHITNDSLADVVKSDRTNILHGNDYFYEELLGLKFKISTFSFFQTNTYSAEVLYQTAREYVGDLGKGEKTVFDLYSGTGTIAQLMAPVAKQVIGVEIVEEAVEAAKKNAQLNGLDNCDFIAGDVLKVLDDIKEKPDMIILDPPRDGIHPKALPKIIDYGVDRIVYISCKPTSLVRDLEVFLERGYVVERAVAVDQFPWTANCEVLTRLVKTDNYVKGNEAATKKKSIDYREEEIPECGCIYG
ncbi:MAG: class I SAM-dependent RNA methyltransferase [Lachnospiraceae bacterium]|nr:class I SAM-dependent RNA methyltransferase [Lachnospiraceae bacterium]